MLSDFYFLLSAFILINFESCSNPSVLVRGWYILAFTLDISTEIIRFPLQVVIRWWADSTSLWYTFWHGLFFFSLLLIGWSWSYLIFLVEINLIQIFNVFRCFIFVLQFFNLPQFREWTDFFDEIFLKLEEFPKKIHVFILSHDIFL